MYRPSSTLSDSSSNNGHALQSSASSIRTTRPARPGGPRRPTAKNSVANLQTTVRAQAQPAHESQDEGRQQQAEENRKSKQELPPSYMQSQNDSQTHIPPRPQSYERPPLSALASEASSSRPTSGSITQPTFSASVIASSPINTSSFPQAVSDPALQTSVDEEETTSSQSLRYEAQLIQRSLHSSPAPEVSSPLPTTECLPSISKPPTPVPDISILGTTPKTRTNTTSFSAPTPLPPPQQINFNLTPISWKALTLEAAQWTFSSDELQAIVSRAIRASAEPSSIRLIPLKTLDEELAQEVVRLEDERAQAQAQYRFTMYRRQMLLQSLNALQYSSSTANSPSSTNPTSNTLNAPVSPAPSPTADLSQRLAEVSGTLDRLAETLVRTTDQIAQIRSLQEVHAGSALAVALRKLNASYARRMKEIQSLKENLAAMEEERDEAWRVAEDLAAEVDEGDYDAEVVEGNIVNVSAPLITQANKVDMHIRIPGVGPRVQRVDITRKGANEGRDVPEEAVILDELPASATGESSTPSSAVPTRTRRRANSASSRVTAARTRSIRASKASLRLPRSRGQSRPPSAYSQISTSRAISRSRPGSIVNSPLDAPSPISPSEQNMVPEVPKMPDAAELARMASVRTNASSKSTASGSKMLPPIPPIPLETSPTKLNGSFLDMATCPSSAVTSEGNSPLKAPDEDSAIKENIVQGLQDLKIKDKNETDEIVDQHDINSSHLREVGETATQKDKEDDGAQIIDGKYIYTHHF